MPRFKEEAREALAPGLILFATILLAYAWWIRDLYPSFEKAQAAANVTFAAVLLFALSCLKSGRWLAFPVAVFGLLALGAIHVSTLLRPVHFLNPPENLIRQAKEQLTNLDRESTLLAQWQAGQMPPNDFPMQVTDINARFIPGLPIAIQSKGIPRYELLRFHGPLESIRPAWEKDASGLAQSIPARRAEAEKNLAAYQLGLLAPPPTPQQEAGQWLEESVVLSGLLLAFNAVALLLRLPFSRRAKLSYEPST